MFRNTIEYNVNRKAAKTSLFSSGNIDQQEYITGEEILTFNQKQTIEHVKFNYSALVKAFEKQTKTIEYPGEKRVKSIQN